MDISIETYRSRIGCFNFSRKHYRVKKENIECRQKASRTKYFSIYAYLILIFAVIVQQQSSLQLSVNVSTPTDNLFNSMASSTPPISVWVIGGHQLLCPMLHRCLHDVTCTHSAVTMGCRTNTGGKRESFKILSALP